MKPIGKLDELTYSRILKFWLPLLATWLMMSVEGPFLTALIARLVEPEYNLAAYGVAFSFALIVESPVIMLMSASIAIVENNNTFIKLRDFIYRLNLALILLMVIIILPPVFKVISIDILNLPERVANLTHMAVVLLIPWAPSIGYRRFYQGILIRNNLTKRVAYGTIIRLMAMSITAIILYAFTNSHGVVIGASALSVGVITEALATRIMSLGVINSVRRTETEKNISFKEINTFYFPLVMTSFISLGIHPIVTFFMGQSTMPLESLAVLPVLNSLVFIFRAFGLSFQEVGVALIKTRSDYIILKRFAFYMAAGVVLGLGLISFTPLGNFWFSKVAGLSAYLTEFAKFPLLLYTIFPATTVWINFQRSVLVGIRNTKPITYASAIEVSGILICLFVAVQFFSMIGVIAAVIAYLTGRFFAIGYLHVPFAKAKKIIFER